MEEADASEDWAQPGSEMTLLGLVQEVFTFFFGHEHVCELLDLLGVSVFTCVLDANVILMMF